MVSLQEAVRLAAALNEVAGDPQLSRDLAERLEALKQQPRPHIHGFHRYFGKLIPALPRLALEAFGAPGSLVLDPFCGSGTTLVEARLAGADAAGIDINPLATLIALAKAGEWDPRRLDEGLASLAGAVAADRRPLAPQEIPFCINREHWFRPEVTTELARLLRHLHRWPEEERPFFLACLSAVVREVSNADPRHVFPGYSKRLRALDAEVGRSIDVLATFVAAARRRIRAYARFREAWPRAGYLALHTASCTQLLPAASALLPRPVDLVVTNPPYLGSVRYLETVKLEMYWLGLVRSPAEYLLLDRQVMATERFYLADYREPPVTGLAHVDELAAALHASGHAKMARAAAEYFATMDQALQGLASALRPGGWAVFKISDSYVRELTLPTHGLLCHLAQRHGLRPAAVFPDAIGSRALLTKRNRYSGIIERDWVVVLQRTGTPPTQPAATRLPVRLAEAPPAPPNGRQRRGPAARPRTPSRGAAPPDTLFVLRYMGGKHRLLDFILPAIYELAPAGQAVCDLMAGTHAVGYALKSRYPVVANDVQAYSAVIGQALLADGGCIDAARAQDELLGVTAEEATRAGYDLFRRLYADTYLSAQQCAEVDRLRYAIARVQDPVARAAYLTALMYAMCYVQQTPGHFAEFLAPDHPRAGPLRQLDLVAAFLAKCDDLARVTPTPYRHKVYCAEALALLAHRELLADVGCFYVDPPYTVEQYSRFYHLLETLIRYDWPEVEHKARYRRDRFLSPFCRRGTVAEAFRQLLTALASYRVPVVISYGSAGLLPRHALEELAAAHFSHVEVREAAYHHSTQGKGRRSRLELLFLCRP